MDINLESLVRTLPTNGPIFGDFKLQMDVFKIPMRLYIAALHNNKLKVGMDMSKVLMPQLEIATRQPDMSNGILNQQQINASSLNAYLGIRGCGTSVLDGTISTAGLAFTRRFNAIPTIAYWDIYKNYYANKQEEIGVVIGTNDAAEEPQITRLTGVPKTSGATVYYTGTPISNRDTVFPFYNWTLTGINLGIEWTEIAIYLGSSGTPTYQTLQSLLNLGRIGNVVVSPDRTQITFSGLGTTSYICERITGTGSPMTAFSLLESAFPADDYSAGIELKSFPLSNIDDMREAILSAPSTNPFVIGDGQNDQIPYHMSVGLLANNQPETLGEMAGLGIKTYMSDRFNNWLDTAWIDDPVSGIGAITAVDTSNGSFTMDTLNLAQKVYDMLNRIAVSGGTYEDWIGAVYNGRFNGACETPVYCGSRSAFIVFNEVVSTAEAQTDAETQPLGTLGGRGKDVGQKGGKINVYADEPCFVMGIVSITPRVDYSQGNKWWTRLETMNDWHKPSLDGIGFQELITDEMAAWDTRVNPDNGVATYNSAGKQPAWIEYMTSQNECYGDFTSNNTLNFMTLTRKYTPDANGRISDLTTYIDPTKFNYAFAVGELKAQNFWVQIGIDCFARRVMSQKIIPNL